MTLTINPSFILRQQIAKYGDRDASQEPSLVCVSSTPEHETAVPSTPLAATAGLPSEAPTASKQDLHSRFSQESEPPPCSTLNPDANSSNASLAGDSAGAIQLRFPSPVLLVVSGPVGTNLLGVVLSSHADPQEPREALVFDWVEEKCIWSRPVSTHQCPNSQQDLACRGSLNANSLVLLPGYNAKQGW